ncbi:MAG: DUF1385 domain-containing protein [Coriobacteriales bacterium]|jgi:uncharacterized protein YqhQ|nr:DUF1385 domain-containing protein [Coriobacteriales bacterium]
MTTPDSNMQHSEGEAALVTPRVRRGDWARARDTEGVVCQTHVGGQALLEGIMMRGKYNWAVAVREPRGDIYIEEHDLVSGRPRNSWMYKPVVRGCTAMVESLALGYRALDIAARHAFDFEDDEPSPEEQESEEPIQSASSDSIPKPLMTISMVLGVVLGIGIFVVLPAIITNLLVGDYGEKTLLWNIVDGLLRIAIFIFYIWLIGRMKDIQRMFGYHGAEHKTIHCYEHGLELTVANARTFPTLHVRCGTAFLLTTMLIAILVFTVVPVSAAIDALGVTNGVLRLVLVILSRIILLPLVAGLSYEVTVKWAGAHPESPLVQFVLWPGLQMQRLTTNEPDDGQLQCAIAAMERVLEREDREQAAKQLNIEPGQATPA